MSELNQKYSAVKDYINDILTDSGHDDIFIKDISIKRKDELNANVRRSVLNNGLVIKLTPDYLDNFVKDENGKYHFPDEKDKYKLLMIVGHEIGHSFFDRGKEQVKLNIKVSIDGRVQDTVKDLDEKRLEHAIRELRADIIGTNLFNIPDDMVKEAWEHKEERATVHNMFEYGYPQYSLRTDASIAFNKLNDEVYKALADKIIEQEGLTILDKDVALNKLKGQELEFINDKTNVLENSKEQGCSSLDSLIGKAEKAKNNLPKGNKPISKDHDHYK